MIMIKMYGVETWVHDYTEEKAIEIADLIQSALMKIYYNPKGNRVLNTVIHLVVCVKLILKMSLMEY